MFRHSVMDGYTLDCLGARGSDPQAAAGALLASAAEFPEFTFVAAACRLKAVELVGLTDETTEQIGDISEMEGEKAAPYRALALQKLNKDTAAGK
jgi:hypothetical protein